MIIVTGHAIAREGADEAMQKLAVEHVLRSRTEPGCVSHEVSRDVQQPERFLFVERWLDMAALQAHFRVEAEEMMPHEYLALQQRGRVAGLQLEVAGCGFALRAVVEEDLLVLRHGVLLSLWRWC